LLSSISSSGDTASSSITQLWDAGGTIGSFAAQPLEPMWQLIHPVVLGCSFWESIHSLTGLPWWASIPVATLGLRTALLPFTIKAKSAGLNFVLAQQATQTATNLLEHWKQQQAASSSSSSAASSGSSGGSSNSLGLGRSEELKRPSWLRLTRMYYRYYRKQHGTTSLWWWSGNIAVQVCASGLVGLWWGCVEGVGRYFLDARGVAGLFLWRVFSCGKAEARMGVSFRKQLCQQMSGVLEFARSMTQRG
jgi:hypothetical protein